MGINSQFNAFWEVNRASTNHKRSTTTENQRAVDALFSNLVRIISIIVLILPT